MKKVVKFGGSSLASAEQFKKVGAIIRADGTRKICGTFCTGQTLFRRYKGNGFIVCVLPRRQ